MTPPKRKADNPGSVAPASKRVATSPSAAKSDFDPSRVEEKYGIVQREFYPAQISNERCEQYNQNQIPRPIEVLEKTLKETASRRDAIDVGDTVVYWYKRDLRLHDNKALSKASERARSKGVPLVCLFVISPQDYQAHLTSSARVDLELRTLAIMKEDLAALNIPLLVNVQDKRETIPDHIIALCRSWNTKHVYCSIEYEVDELRRETLIINKCLQNGISFNALHDDVIVPPGELSSGAGKQYSVYSPWYRAWMAHIHKYPQILSEFPAPTENPPSTKEKFKPVFESAIPPAPENKTLTEEEKHRFQSLWPAGEHEALARLQKFLKEKITKYKETRNFPAENSTALLSPHFAAGTLSARAAVRNARDANSTKKLDGGNPGIVGWVSEVAWRDFYKHVLAHWPYVCMNKSFKYEYSSIGWSYNMEHFQKWTEGMTGFPIVDAAMRQMNYMGYMHNRCRMIVASFFTKDLLLDWRMGERWFMEHLIDGDFASNNGGWGFSASTGVDPQPYFRIFNPLLQSEKFDATGDYIRKWVPELRDVKGKAVHDPYGRGSAKEAARNGYPKPIVDHSAQRKKALDMYKTGLGRDTA